MTPEERLLKIFDEIIGPLYQRTSNWDKVAELLGINETTIKVWRHCLPKDNGFAITSPTKKNLSLPTEKMLQRLMDKMQDGSIVELLDSGNETVYPLEEGIEVLLSVLKTLLQSKSKEKRNKLREEHAGLLMRLHLYGLALVSEQAFDLVKENNPELFTE